jgi:UDP-2,3-diacylglucosamine pyrophosphatase LpxH
MATATEEASMIIVVADLHLGSQMANKSGFSKFVQEFLEPNQDDISHLILLGDILDLWRNKNSQVIVENLDILTELGQLDMKKNYLVGNHDYAILSLLSNQSTLSVSHESIGVFDHVSETLSLESNGLKLKFIHGHQIDYWCALGFYEIFSQAMCFVDDNDGQELSNVWNIIYRFAESLPEKSRNQVRNLPKEIQDNLEQKLAGPVVGTVLGEKKGLYYEWELLRKVSDFDEVSLTSSMNLDDIIRFSEDWKRILMAVDHYQGEQPLPLDLENELYNKRRKAASIIRGLQEDEFLIRGHGHSPYVSQEIKVADAGCWLGERGSFLKIIDGQVSIHKWRFKKQ